MKLLCIKTVLMQGDGEEAFTKGKIYEATRHGDYVNATNNDGNAYHGLSDIWCALKHFQRVKE